MNSLSEIKNIFTSSKDFPRNECTHKGEEDGIYYSNKKYWCLVIDKRFKNSVRVEIMTPYIWIPADYKAGSSCGCAWSHVSLDLNVDNLDSSLNGNLWDEYVIAFSEYDESLGDDLWKFIENELSEYDTQEEEE